MFSIIIPAYNYADVLDRSIRSVLNQTGDDFEILLLSTTAQLIIHLKLCACYQKEFPEKIKYFIQKNQGPAAARNKGVEFSFGNYLFFLDADDEMAPDLLDKLAKKISDKPSVDVIFGDHISIDHNGEFYI
jgi:glycosyltransferase involved in cell wall biosynthesis